jgi:hypothetical protein
MRKTTVYLPDELKARVERLARESQRSEAEVIRDALERLTADVPRPRPQFPLFEGPGNLAENVDDELAGFGEE